MPISIFFPIFYNNFIVACAKDEHDAAAMMAYEPGDELYVLYGTDTLELAYQVYDQMKDIARSRAAEQEVQA